jgi:hypothetical protein
MNYFISINSDRYMKNKMHHLHEYGRAKPYIDDEN